MSSAQSTQAPPIEAIESEYLPAAQAAHDEYTEPTRTEYFPAEQLVQAFELATLYLPAAQAAHDEVWPEAYMPATHATQAVACAAEDDPPVQIVHETAPEPEE